MSTVSNRAETPSRWRRLAQLVLGLGAVLAVAAAFGPTWVIRAGIAIAIVAGVAAAVLLWRQVREERQRRLADSSAHAEAQGAILRAERNQHLSVLSSMESHNSAAAERVRVLSVDITELRKQLAAQQEHISTLRGDKAALEAQVAQLRTDLAAREAEVRALTDDDAELLALPRRVASSDWDALPKADDIWAEGDYPTVVDLQSLALGTIDEEQRRQA